MKKIRSVAWSLSILLLASCKSNNSGSTNTTATNSPATASKQSIETPVTKGPQFETAQAYNDYIINRQKEIYTYIFKMSDGLKVDVATAEKVIDEALPVIDKVIEDVNAMPAFNGDTSFRNAAIKLFEFYRTTFNTSYRQVMAINKKGSKMTLADQTKLQKISSDVSITENGLDMIMKSAQSNFATSNNSSVVENTELQKKVDNLAK